MTPVPGFFGTPPLRYYGSKWMLADWILSHLPPHDSYVEPFCGSAAVFFRKPPSAQEVLNDLDGEVVNFFRVLREQPDALIRAIDMTPYSRAEYHTAYESSPDPLERARRFYIRTRMSFGGSQRSKSGWRFQIAPHERGTSLSREWQRLDGLAQCVFFHGRRGCLLEL